MTRYVVSPDVAIRLAHERAVIGDQHQILAPTLLRSQMLSSLYQAVHRGEMTKKDAEQRLDYVRGLRIRLLGDRVLQNVAWKVADQLGWPDTFDAEYVLLDPAVLIDRTAGDIALVSRVPLMVPDRAEGPSREVPMDPPPAARPT